MSRKINIGGDESDFSYRYKRDIIEVKYENKNGSQTKITNLEIISKQLHVKVEELQGCFKKNIASSYHHDTINGKMEIKELEVILEKFIHKYVLCPICKYPELDDDICRSCGYTKKKKMSDPEQNIDKELDKVASQFDIIVDCPSNKYIKIKEKARKLLEKKLQKDRNIDVDIEKEKIDYELTKDEWVNSDYGHSKLDSNICELLHKLYDKRNKLRESKLYSLLDFQCLSKIEIIISKLWKCTKKSEFKILYKEVESLLE